MPSNDPVGTEVLEQRFGGFGLVEQSLRNGLFNVDFHLGRPGGNIGNGEMVIDRDLW